MVPPLRRGQSTRCLKGLLLADASDLLALLKIPPPIQAQAQSRMMYDCFCE